MYLSPDISVPEIIYNLGEVDILSEGPGHVLSDTRRVVEATGASLAALLVKDPGEASCSHAGVADHGALVGPHLGHLCQLRVPGQGGQAGLLREHMFY